VFERATLQRSVEAAGFRIAGWRHLSEGYLLTALAIALAAKDGLPPRLARVVGALVHARPVRLAMQPLFALLDRALGGGWVTLVAQRRPVEA